LGYQHVGPNNVHTADTAVYVVGVISTILLLEEIKHTCCEASIFWCCGHITWPLKADSVLRRKSAAMQCYGMSIWCSYQTTYFENFKHTDEEAC
jgi:hypothetical protein